MSLGRSHKGWNQATEAAAGWNGGGHLDGGTFWVTHFLLPSWDLIQKRPSQPQSAASPASAANRVTMLAMKNFILRPAKYCPIPWSLIPTPQAHDFNGPIPGRAPGWRLWNETDSLREDLPKGWTSGLRPHSPRHNQRHSETPEVWPWPG